MTHTPLAPFIVRTLAIALLTVVAAPQPTAAAQAGSAAEFYMSYRAAFDKATKIEDLLPFLAAKNRQEVEKTPADDKVKFFEMMKMFGAMSNVKVVKSAKNGAGELLTVEGTTEGKKQTCTVQIVNEKTAWKLGEEKCQGSF